MNMFPRHIITQPDKRTTQKSSMGIHN
uniref:Uncharacterized protein n=1 Tax=Anguilla anguilla TaxID=7936 RepID=A0A0E9SLC1_ANGAN